MTELSLFDDPTDREPTPEHRVQFVAGCLITWLNYDYAKQTGRDLTKAERRSLTAAVEGIARDAVERATRLRP